MKIEESANEKNQILSEHKAIIANYTETHTRAKENLKKFKDDITAAEEKVVGLETEKDQLEENIPQMENDEHEKTAQVAKMQDERVATQEKLAQLQSKLNDAKESGGDAKQKHQVFEYIMGLKRAKRVPGIIGRLGDLGGIPKKFDVALSSSCGMDVMIVEKSEQAKDIVELMKKDRAGACTFFALDKLQPFREADRNLPGPRLVDEIWTEDERLKKAFYKACGNTLYADNISIARKMGNSGGQRHRVVSLDGSVVEPTGTFTGGGSRKMSGAMAEKPQIQVNKETISDDEIREMEDGVNELRDQIRNFDFEIRKLNGDIAQLRKQLQKSKERLKLIASEYETASERIKLLQARIKPAEKEVKDTEPDKKELRKLEDELKDAEVEYGATKAQADEARSEVDDLNKQIGEKGKGKIETIKKNIKKTKKDIADTNKKILKVQNDAKTAERNRNKAEMDVQRLADEEKELKERVEAIKAETDKLVEEFTEVEADLKEVKELLDGAKIHEAECQKNSSEMEKQIETLTNELQKFKSTQKENTSKINELQGLIRDLKKRLERLTIEQIDIEDDLTIATLTEEEFGEGRVDLPALILASEQMKAELDQNRPNLGALQEYRTRQKVYLERQKEYNAINDARNAKREVRNDLMKRRHSEFMEGFDLITNKVKQMYQMITLGGDAELELVNSLAPFDDGVSFTVRPPKKSWKNIMNLSGGEKTLSSLALVFALHHYKPTPLYVMDEIDAALDIKNVSIIANYIKDRTKNAQFIIISLRNQMFCLASRLCGIYKTNNCTKMVVVTNRRPEDEKENEATGPSKTISVRSPMKPSILSQSQMDQN